MILQKEREPGAVTPSPQIEVSRQASFAVIVAPSPKRCNYREMRGELVEGFRRYCDRGGDLDAIAWMYHHRVDAFNAWVEARTQALARRW